jgi:hypothetical protein
MQNNKERKWNIFTMQQNKEELHFGAILGNQAYKLQAARILTAVHTPTARHRVSAITERPATPCPLSL